MDTPPPARFLYGLVFSNTITLQKDSSFTTFIFNFKSSAICQLSLPYNKTAPGRHLSCCYFKVFSNKSEVHTFQRDSFWMIFILKLKVFNNKPEVPTLQQDSFWTTLSILLAVFKSNCCCSLLTIKVCLLGRVEHLQIFIISPHDLATIFLNRICMTVYFCSFAEMIDMIYLEFV